MAFSANMLSMRLHFILVLMTALITAALYNPASLVIYKITEPYFRCPINLESRGIAIRHDARGGGGFGARRGNGRSHSGIDIQAKISTPVYAAKSGIAFRGNIPTGYGKYVMIYHPDGFQTLYGHLSDWNIASTQKVSRGDVIGFVGKSGNAAHKDIEPHLHFEIKKDGEPHDPQYLMR